MGETGVRHAAEATARHEACFVGEECADADAFRARDTFLRWHGEPCGLRFVDYRPWLGHDCPWRLHWGSNDWSAPIADWFWAHRNDVVGGREYADWFRRQPLSLRGDPDCAYREYIRVKANHIAEVRRRFWGDRPGFWPVAPYMLGKERGFLVFGDRVAFVPLYGRHWRFVHRPNVV
jgi:hypothetical protein